MDGRAVQMADQPADCFPYCDSPGSIPPSLSNFARASPQLVLPDRGRLVHLVMAVRQSCELYQRNSVPEWCWAIPR